MVLIPLGLHSRSGDELLGIRVGFSFILELEGSIVKEEHSKQDQILLVRIGNYVGFSVYHGSYLPWSPVLIVTGLTP